jgi:hypothetical protein
MYFKGHANIKTHTDDGVINQEIDKFNTWTKDGHIFDYSDKYSIGLIVKDTLNRPYSTLAQNNDYWSWTDNVCNLGSICWLCLEVISIDSIRNTNYIQKAETLTPNSYRAGTYSGIIFMHTPGYDYTSVYRNSITASIIRFDTDLVITSADNLTYAYTIYMSASKII